jgi:hypothetical protein
MDVKDFQNSRNAKLAEFKKQYQFLKAEYASTLSSAIKEADPNQQQILIQRSQQINSQLTEELNTMIGSIIKGSNGFDSKELDDLTNDLIKYQKDYAEIEKSKDKVTTLKIIHSTTSEKLRHATFMYYFYILILLGLCIYVSYLVFTTSIAERFTKKLSIGMKGPLM